MKSPFTVDIEHAKVSVIGAARSGLAAARLLVSRGARVFVSELSAASDMEDARSELDGIGAASEFGGHSERVQDANLIVLSPGVRADAAVLQEAARSGIPLISEIELACMFCKAPIIAVTGTNGKTTTTTLVGDMCRMAGLSTIVAGNIGKAFCDALLELPAPDVAVLEVSSYQLDFTVRFHPATAVITTITPDHLGRYGGDFQRYVASKQRIFRNQYHEDALIFNADNTDTAQAVRAAAARCYPTSVGSVLEFGGWMEARTLVIDSGGGKEIVASINDLHLRGKHNFMNILQASLAARLHGVSADAIARAVKAFRGVEHRLEFVRNLDGVTYVNDSKATNVDSLVIALQSFHQPVVLIAGGRDKESPYDPLLPLIDEKVRAVVLIGEAADRMERAFAGHTRIQRARSLPDAVGLARGIASAGDAVLLSPACASFDMFEHFEHRGLVFKSAVMALEAKRRN